MNKEALQNIGEKLSLASENLRYFPPMTVGTRLVRHVIQNDQEPQTAQVHLAFPEEVEESSKIIHNVPLGWIEKGNTAEIIVRKSKSNYEYLYPIPTTFLTPKSWLVAIRKFDPHLFGQEVDPSDPDFNQMFRSNYKTLEIASAFLKLFQLE